MKNEYDFSNSEKGKFFTPLDKIEVPVYLDKSVRAFYASAAMSRKIDLDQMVNAILKKEMEIQQDILSGKQ